MGGWLVVLEVAVDVHDTDCWGICGVVCVLLVF